MSFTETQLIHRLSHSPPRPHGTFILATGVEQDDKGLIMNIDAKLGESIRPINPAGRAPVTPQFCNQIYSLSGWGWGLRAASYIQNAHITFVTFIKNVNDNLQKKAVQIIPLFLYMSLLVLGIQSVAIISLLAQSLLPLGMWFLMSCISMMGYIFCATAVITEPSLMVRSSYQTHLKFT